VTVEEAADLTETPDPYGAFPSLTEEQVAALETVGERSSVKRGDILYKEGESSGDFFVILERKVAAPKESSSGLRIIGVHGPRRFLGELGLLTGQTVFVTAVVVEPGRCSSSRRRSSEDRDPGSGARRSDPASVADAPPGPDRARGRHAHHRFAVLAGYPKIA
jgi:CRP-like cAMP-binding protein